MSERVREVSDGAFRREVLESDKPVLVDFWGPECPPCRVLAPTVEAIAEQYSDDLVVTKLNVSENPSTAIEYGVRGIPTLILFSGGREVERTTGTTSKEAISRMIERGSGLPTKRSTTNAEVA